LWRGLSDVFFGNFLQNKGPVSASIQRSLAPYALADILKSMVDLCIAVDYFIAGEYGRVLDVLDGLPVMVLPQEEDQVAAAADLKLHDSLASVLDDIVLMAMRAVRSLYEQTRFQQKSSSAGIFCFDLMFMI